MRSSDGKYRELPFLEKEFTEWMYELENILENSANWRRVLLYRDISIFDAGYIFIHFGILNEYKAIYSSNKTHGDELNQPSRRIVDIADHLRNGNSPHREIARVISQKLKYQIRMLLPPKKLRQLNNEKKKVLLIRAYPNLTGFPVLSSLMDDFDYRIIFGSWNRKLAEPANKLGLKYVDLEDLYRRKYISLKNKHSKLIKERLSNIDPFEPGKILSRISGYQIHFDITQLFRKIFSQVCTYVDIYFDLLNQVSPKIVTLFNEVSPPGRTLARVAAKMEIPSVAIQHGLFIGNVYRSLSTNNMLVWGSGPKKFWLDRGCSSDQIICVGAIGHENWKIRTQAKLYSSEESPHPLALFVGQNPGMFISVGLYQHTVDAFINAAEKLPEFKFAIKPHPGEDAELHISAIKSSKSSNIELISDSTMDLYAALSKADLVITLFSTVGVEAMLLGIPVIVLNFSSDHTLAPFTSASLLVRDSDDLSAAILRVLDDEAYRQDLINRGRQFAMEYFGLMDGRSAQRAAQAIVRIAESAP